MIVAQVTLLGYLALKQAAVAAPLMVPLPIITLLFLCYIKQRHFRVTRYLSSEDAARHDQSCMEDGGDFDFVRGKYRQPALKTKVLLPDNAPNQLSQGGSNDRGQDSNDSLGSTDSVAGGN